MSKAICIAREFGSGGRVIGKLLADKLGFKFFDNKLVDLAAKRANIPIDHAKKADEKAVNPWSYAPIFGGYYNIYTNQSDSERMFTFETEIIREEALKQDSVFVGRAADYALEELSEVQLLSFFIYAPEDWRIKRLIETEGFKTKSEAFAALKRKDRQRINYYNFFTGKEYSDPLNYDLCLDSSFLGIEKSAQFLSQSAKFLFENFQG